MSERKVFVISLHRVMTRSTDAHLSMLGLRTVHFPKFFRGQNLMEAIRGHETDRDRVVDTLAPLIESADAFSDVPIPTLYRELAARWPESVFVFVDRDPEGWARSVRGHLRARKLSPYNKVQYAEYLGPNAAAMTQVTDAQLQTMYREHRDAVAHHFNNSLGQPDRLCMVSINDPRIGETISTFLGCPPLPMPRISGRPSATELVQTRQWVEQCPDKADARYYYAKNLIEAGETTKAKAQLVHACTAEPDHPKPFMLLSELLHREGAHQEAAEAADGAIRAGLHRPRLYRRAAKGFLRGGRPATAVAYWARSYYWEWISH